jgi:hypothetical protein
MQEANKVYCRPQLIQLNRICHQIESNMLIIILIYYISFLILFIDSGLDIFIQNFQLNLYKINK